jgi:hypothetical protein
MLLDCDLTISSPDAKFWQTVLDQVESAGLDRARDRPRPKTFSSWSSLKTSILRKIPKQGMCMDGKNPMRLQFSWWWSFYNVEVARNRFVEALRAHYTERGLMNGLEVDSPDDIKRSVFSDTMWNMMNLRRSRLREPHCRTREWSEVPDDPVTEGDLMDVDSEDGREQSKSLDPTAIPSIEHDLSGDGYYDDDGEDIESDSAQVASQSISYERFPTLDPQVREKCEEFERLLATGRATLRRRTSVGRTNHQIQAPVESPAREAEEEAAGVLGTPSLRRLTQDSANEMFSFTPETPTSVNCSRESTAAACSTPPSSSPMLAASPPKQLALRMRTLDTLSSSPKAVMDVIQPQCLHNGPGYSITSTPAASKSVHHDHDQDKDITTFERQTREETHPRLRRENEEHQRRKHKVKRGEIDSNVSYLVTRTMLKPPSGHGLQKGEELASNTGGGIDSLSLRTSDACPSSKDNKALGSDGYHSDDTTDSEIIFPTIKDLRRADEAAKALRLAAKDAEAQNTRSSATAAVVTTDHADSQIKEDITKTHSWNTSDCTPRRKGKRGRKKPQQRRYLQHSPTTPREQYLFLDDAPKKRDSSSLDEMNSSQKSSTGPFRAPKKPKNSDAGQNVGLSHEAIVYRVCRKITRNRNRRLKRWLNRPQNKSDAVTQKVIKAICQAEEDSEDEERHHSV